jgi:alkanesulfonate monooxygenase
MISPSRPLRFHWSLSQAGEKLRRAQAATAMSGLPRLEAQRELCQLAEQSGIDSMLMAIGFARPDPILLSVALGLDTTAIKFMIACRPGLVSPTLFVQQINTLSALTSGRVHVNVVAGHTPKELGYYGDFLDHDGRYDRIDEFLEICHQFWGSTGEVNFRGRYYRIEGGRLNTPFVSATASTPEIYMGGSSGSAALLAARHASCLWRLACEPKRFAREAEPVLQAGKEVGVLVSLITRQTQREARKAAEDLIASFDEETRAVHRNFIQASDSVGYHSTFERAHSAEGPWEGRCLWCGAVPYLGAPSIALVGSADEVADALIEYKQCGVSQFLFMGWPDDEEMTRFGRDVLPLVRERESRETASLVAGGFAQ